MKKYLVTTRLEAIPSDRIVIMVDGTVPNWEPKDHDLHFDHHRLGGAKVQIDEIPYTVAHSYDGDELFVTTQVDADACVAAAWCQLGDSMGDEQVRKLRAIAYDCDHLCVPPELEDLADFAAQAVAAMKDAGFKLAGEMGLPEDRRTWTVEQREAAASAGFEQGTEWLLSSLRGDRPFPGEQGEAKEYWEQVQKDTVMLAADGRIIIDRGVYICDTRGISRYIDPRCFILNLDVEDSRPETITIRDRKDGGISYTLGCNPKHLDVDKLDYCRDLVYDKLNVIERSLNPNFGGWGG